jgi:serine phosphatase RsbU (regulator of sigma subunit)
VSFLRIEPQGTVIVANAGHLAPYLAGQEIAVENGLPLGITGETDHPEVSIQLPVGAQLTLYADGVVEARARSGEPPACAAFSKESRMKSANVTKFDRKSGVSEGPC